MFRNFVRACVGLLVVGLAGATLAGTAGAAARTQQQGVTDNEIQVIALVADLDGLRARGLIAQPKLTTGNLLKRWQAYADAYGPINGRKVTVKGVTWDPLDTTTFDKACIQATQDNKPFVVVNGNGFRPSAVSCITVDNNTPVMLGDPMYNALFEESGDNLFGLLPPSDAIAPATAAVVAKQGLIPKTAKIGILSGNEPGIKAGGDALEAALKKAGYTIPSGAKVEVNINSADATVMNRESAAAVGTMKALGVDTVFVAIPFTSSQGYFQELNRSNAGFKSYVLDGSSSMCTIFAASRIPLDAAGIPCLTTADTRAVSTKDGVKKDSAAEAKCRATFDKAFAQTSQPGVPSGDVVTPSGTYVEDFPSNECQIMNMLLPAIEKAGKKLTWAKVAKNLEKTSGPAIYASGGEGSYTPKKHYFNDNVHLVTLNAANAQTPKDANGLFNGCPAPVNCWIPQLIDGGEWFSMQSGKAAA
jgi:hypothetical protein